MLKVFLAILLPPVAVALERGASQSLVINIVLTILGWIPGAIHAVLVIR